MQKCKLNFLLRFGLISILLGLFVTQSFAQNVTITGVVKDQSGEPLIGVNVMEKGTTNGSITDVDGKYSVSVKGGKTILVFSYIGYISQEIPVGNQKTLNVTMKEDTEELEEVVVIGYGTAKKKDLTGAISRVKAEKMEVEAPRSVQDLLRASAAGLSISMSTDAAGTADLQVRGKNSLKAGSSPLLVLDGVIYDGSLQDINPMDIESIDVLKDASSVAVYGAKAANGVVAITTKKGKTGKPVISFNANVGMVSNARLPKTVDGAGFIKFRQEYGEIKLRELASILRFADELSEGPQRTSHYLNSKSKIAEDAQIYHEYASITNIFVDKGNNRIAITYNIDYTSSERIEELLEFTYRRILKLDAERRYCKYYAPILDKLKKTDAQINFTINGDICDLDLPKIELGDKYNLIDDGNDTNIVDHFIKNNPVFNIHNIVEKLNSNKDE